MLLNCSSDGAGRVSSFCGAGCLLLADNVAGLEGGCSAGCKVTLPVVSLILWLFADAWV